MPSPKVPCPQCGSLKSAKAALCGACGKGKYVRTPEHREALSRTLTGMERPYARGVPRPEVAKKIAAAWTPEMREAARVRGLAFADDPEWRAKVGMSGEANPNYQGKGASEYAPGFSRGMKRRLMGERGGACEACGATSNLDVHHLDESKTNHAPENLKVLCRSCHKSLHFASSENT